MPECFDVNINNIDFSLLRLRATTECKIWDSFRKGIGYPTYINTGNLKNWDTFAKYGELYKHWAI